METDIKGIDDVPDVGVDTRSIDELARTKICQPRLNILFDRIGLVTMVPISRCDRALDSRLKTVRADGIVLNRPSVYWTPRERGLIESRCEQLRTEIIGASFYVSTMFIPQAFQPLPTQLVWLELNMRSDTFTLPPIMPSLESLKICRTVVQYGGAPYNTFAQWVANAVSPDRMPALRTLSLCIEERVPDLDDGSEDNGGIHRHVLARLQSTNATIWHYHHDYPTVENFCTPERPLGALGARVRPVTPILELTLPGHKDPYFNSHFPTDYEWLQLRLDHPELLHVRFSRGESKDTESHYGEARPDDHEHKLVTLRRRILDEFLAANRKRYARWVVLAMLVHMTKHDLYRTGSRDTQLIHQVLKLLHLDDAADTIVQGCVWMSSLWAQRLSGCTYRASDVAQIRLAGQKRKRD